MKNSTRNPNFEILRIIAIIMILILHYLNGDLGGALSNTIAGTNNFYAIRFIEGFSIVAVNCFVLITGYYMIDKTAIKLYKPINLVLIAIFYSLVLYLISIYLNINTFTLEGLKTIMMVMYNPKWFMVAYIGLFILIPYLNKIVVGMDEYQYRKLIIVLIVLLSIVPTFFNKVCYNDGGYGVLSFIMIYFIGGYLKLHYKAERSKIYYFAVYILCTTAATILMISNIIDSTDGWWTYWNYNDILIVVGSIGLFLFFEKMNIKSNRIINYLATFTFPIYLIHTDLSVRVLIYKTIFKCDKYWNNPLLFVNMAKTIIGLYIGCILIESIRRIIMKPISNIIKTKPNIEISA